MKILTPRQQQILDFIQMGQNRGEIPSLREIARHFKFRSPTAVRDHLYALEQKGVLKRKPRTARGMSVISVLNKFRSVTMDIPIFGEIPAGLPSYKVQEAQGCISVDVKSLGIQTSARTFALQVRGDSMIGKQIVDGDYVVLEHGVTPRSGDVVAALIDNESTLKTFLMEQGKPYLRAENPRYPKLIPASELVIQGVMRGLIRKFK
jgi:repressor LexA